MESRCQRCRQKLPEHYAASPNPVCPACADAPHAGGNWVYQLRWALALVGTLAVGVTWGVMIGRAQGAGVLGMAMLWLLGSFVPGILGGGLVYGLVLAFMRPPAGRTPGKNARNGAALCAGCLAMGVLWCYLGPFAALALMG